MKEDGSVGEDRVLYFIGSKGLRRARIVIVVGIVGRKG
jgi:hypothetical protein